MKEFTPLEVIENALSRWWVLVILTILGGIVGLFFPISRPPIYEAEATIAVSIDFTQVRMSQYDEDYTFGVTGALIASTAVKEQVVTRAQSEGLEIQLGQFSSYLEIKQSIWKLKVRHTDPQIAAKLANIWAEEAYATLEQSRHHALQAQYLHRQENNLMDCLSSACAAYTLKEIQEALQTVSTQIENETNASNGILPSLEFALSEEAFPPDQPVAYDRGKMVLGGALIGFVVGIWGINLWHIHRRVEGGPHA